TPSVSSFVGIPIVGQIEVKVGTGANDDGIAGIGELVSHVFSTPAGDGIPRVEPPVLVGKFRVRDDLITLMSLPDLFPAAHLQAVFLQDLCSAVSEIVDQISCLVLWIF